MAADAGMEAVWISDHFHPWLDDQGESPFVWTVIGAIAALTPLHVTTAVTCPIMRMHPALVAHAAATSALLLDGRFDLGVGTGEYLNEHIYGDRWPASDERRAMLEEAVSVIRALWSGEEITHRGSHYEVEAARLYSVPATPPAIVVSAFGPKTADLAARIADGFVSTRADEQLLRRYRDQGGPGFASGSLRVCWGADRDKCVDLAHTLWRSSGLPGELGQELRTPALFDQASMLVSPESVAEHFPCGPDVDAIVAAAKEYLDAGFDRLFLNQIGPDQREFFDFFVDDLAPALEEIGCSTRAGSIPVNVAVVGD
jgi:G6PDH family F420-dependent oxidoreductase